MLPISRQCRTKPVPSRSTGFSLVEIMVGMVIGLLGIIVIMNLFSNFEAQKRSTAGASEVQNDGAIALYNVQHDIQKAGYGINTVDTTLHPKMFGCKVIVPANPAPLLPPAAFTIPAIAPVTINSALVPAGDPNTDTLLVIYSNSNTEPEGNIISPIPAAIVQTFNVKTASDQANDFVLVVPIAPPAPCVLTVDYLNAGSSSTNLTVQLHNGIPSANIPVVAGNAGSGTLFNLGSANQLANTSFSVIGYAVRSGSLTVCDFVKTDCTNNLANWLPIANGIVSLMAQYGRDANPAPPTNMDGVVDVWDQTQPANACGWMRTSAVRVALVGRNGQPNLNAVTAVAPTWAGSATNPINLLNSTSAAATLDWTHYRYKVFETTAIIRNISMNGAVPGC